MKYPDSWEQWSNIHDNIDQQKRLASARSAACTPIELNLNAETGAFQGKHGSYQTSLSVCSCGDFIRRHLPCKHMYRLALEFKYIDGDFKSDSAYLAVPKSKAISLAKSIEQIESLSIDTQIVLRRIISQTSSKDPYACVSSQLSNEVQTLIAQGFIEARPDLPRLISIYTRKELYARLEAAGIECNKRLSKGDLYEWCLENIPDNIPALCHEYMTVILTDSYRPNRTNITRYLNRKFDMYEYIDFDTGKLPEDIVTEYLKKYGYYDEKDFEEYF